VTIRSYNSSDVNIFLKIQRKSEKHHPAHTDVIAAPGVNSFIMLDNRNNVMLVHMKR
jgi:hypothetical protein